MIKDSLYKAFTSQINYARYIEGSTFKVDSKTDFELLSAINAGFLYTMLFEDYFRVDKEHQKVTTLLTDQYTEELINEIATKTKDGYTFGEPGKNLGYSSKELALYKLRNKIAHGEFYLRNGNLIFVENNTEAVVNLQRFIGVVKNLEYYGDASKKCGVQSRMIYLNKTKNKKIDEKNIDSIAKSIYQVKILDKPLPLCARDTMYIQALELIRKRDVDYVNNHPNLHIDAYKAKFKEFSEEAKEKYKINLEYSIVPVYELEEYQEIKEKFLNKCQKFEESHIKLESSAQIDILAHTVHGIENENKVTIRKGVALNLAVLEELKDDPELTKDEIVRKLHPMIAKLVLINMDDIIMMTYLVGFYSLFQYGLETSLTKSNERRMYDIFDRKEFDFSYLDVDCMETATRINEMSLPSTDFPKDKYKKLGNYRGTLKNLEDGYKTMIDGNNLEKAKSLKEKIEKTKETYLSEALPILEELDDYMNYVSEFNKDKYLKNLDIIYHVRNAIAHGNIKVIRYGKDIFDTVIRIIDKTNGRTGNIVYDKELTMEEFVKIFSSTNIELLYYYLQDHIDDEEVIEENYFEDLCKKIVISNYY